MFKYLYLTGLLLATLGLYATPAVPQAVPVEDSTALYQQALDNKR